jgi:hypothetical protein
MALSIRHMDVLIDVVENKLSDAALHSYPMPVWDGEERKAAIDLKFCLGELQAMKAVAFKRANKRGYRAAA